MALQQLLVASIDGHAPRSCPPTTLNHHHDLQRLPDELVLRILYFLDVDDLLSVSRTSRALRALSLDPLLQKYRLQHSFRRVGTLLPRRPPLNTLQPPTSTIYLNKTHLAARRLHWSLVGIRLNRSLSRRPPLSALVSANILPKECCRVDRTSGEFVWGAGVAGALVERKRRVEREQIKEGLRVWLERKAREIRSRRKKDDVSVLVWRFSRKARFGDTRREANYAREKPNKDKVSNLRRFFETKVQSLGNGMAAS